jgi:hypothetical protein
MERLRLEDRPGHSSHPSAHHELAVLIRLGMAFTLPILCPLVWDHAFPLPMLSIALAIIALDILSYWLTTIDIFCLPLTWFGIGHITWQRRITVQQREMSSRSKARLAQNRTQYW